MWGAGNIHLGTATATMVVPIAAAGQGIYSIAPQSDIAGTQQIVLGKKGQEIVRSPKDFEKLKIGMPKGASVTMAIQAMAKDTGVDFTKIQFVNLAPPDSVTALAKGDIDAMAGWAPWVFNAVKQGGGKVYFTGNRSFIPGKEGQVDWLLVHAGVVASGEDGEGQPEHAEGGAARAATRPRRPSTPTARPSVKIVAARDEDGRGHGARHHGAQHLLDGDERQDLPQGMGDFVDFLHSLTGSRRRSPPESVFYTKLLEEVDPKLVKWKAKTEVK